MEVLDKIILLLKQNSHTQKELTDYLGLEKSTFSSWKSGKSQSYYKYIPQIASFLGTTPDYLWGWTDDPTDYENTEENLNAPLDSIEHFDGDPKQIYEFQKTVEHDYYEEQRKKFEAEQIELIARHLANVPAEDRERLLKNFGETVDIYLAAKGIKKKND